MIKTFKTIKAFAGHGARIFVHPDEVTECSRLSEMCKWGGHDKELNGMWGFEFSDDMFSAMVEWMKSRGFSESEWRRAGQGDEP